MRNVPVLFPVLVSALTLNLHAAPKAGGTPAPSAAPQSPALADGLVVSVDGTRLLRKDLDPLVEKMVKTYSARIPASQIEQARAQIRTSLSYKFVMDTLLVNEAKRVGITVTGKERQAKRAELEGTLKAQGKSVEEYFRSYPLGEEVARRDFESAMLVEKLFNTQVVSKIKVTESEIRNEIASLEKKSAEIKARNQALGAAREKALQRIKAIRKRLADGAKFEEIAKNESDCPSRDKGGDLGTFTRGQMVKPFEEAAFSQEIGKVGEIVETPFGFHLIKVTARTPAVGKKDGKPARPESVTASHILIKAEMPVAPARIPSREEIRAKIQQKSARAETQAYIQRLKKGAKIETRDPMLKSYLR